MRDFTAAGLNFSLKLGLMEYASSAAGIAQGNERRRGGTPADQNCSEYSMIAVVTIAMASGDRSEAGDRRAMAQDCAR